MREHLKNRRKELGLTLEQVGQSVGVGKSTIRRWENGLINNIGSDKILLLAKALKVSPSFILGDNDNHDPIIVFDDRELIDKLLKENLPAYTQELSEITYEASSMKNTNQKLLLRIIEAIKHNQED
ncbi:Transcriptional repressor DicA [Macrococcoides canis]|uniref:Transcriptional repressor DicA n=1 Tax=Macrococcoides canis TaxID=1855823 RepID=A0A1W7AES3_9STAP|nr:helix-turn-helix transcriptional regulator [Macrococcus canis]ARQ08088.1 transcriptional repressor DicA [Macrococcus canis]